MTADGDDSTSVEDYGGFVFSEESGGLTSGSPLPSLEQRLAPIVALLVIVSLLLVGSYIAFATLSDPSGNVLGASGSAGGSGGSIPSGGSPPTSSPTDIVTTTPASPLTAETTDTGTVSATPAADPTGNDTTSPFTTTETPRTRTTDERTATDTTTTAVATTTATETTESTTDATTAGDTTTSPAETTATPADRSPSINALSTGRGESNGSMSLAVDWAVSDPDGDLMKIEIVVVEASEDGARVVSRRTVGVDGSDASDQTVFAIDDGMSKNAYEIRLEAEDDAGNVALAVTRDAPDE